MQVASWWRSKTRFRVTVRAAPSWLAGEYLLDPVKCDIATGDAGPENIG